MSGSLRTIAILRYAAVAVFGASISMMAYGLYHYPAAPIRYVDGQYLDKRGRIHSRAEFEHFRFWEKAFFASWGASAVAALSYQYATRRRGR